VTKKAQTILLAIIGIGLVVVIVVVGVGVWAVRSMVNNADMDPATATKAMDDVRARFGQVTPVFDVRPSGVTMSRVPPDTRPPGELKTLHILRWDVHEERLTRVDIPFWMIRMRNSSIDVMSDGTVSPGGASLRTSTKIRVEDVERFGSALLVDGDLPDGGHLVIWSE
jgi:hypothetical protein